MNPFIGEIVMFAGNFAPRSWAFCNGQLLPIAQNTALFSILGTTYGGDGRTTFALPDLRGRTPIHPGHGPGLSTYRLGQKGGSEEHTLTIGQMPTHNHIAASNTDVNVGDTGGESDPDGNFLGEGDAYTGASAGNKLNGGAMTTASSMTNTGGGQSFNTMKPFGTANYIICMFGSYPSRN
ncbi:microcystin dependent MdpB family protein [Dokdonia pacifica]|uniref:Microcystin-dependent protein n=1 Tax=Dokdonia pacifica TaxID=1627892 RepID=A0A239CS69_9FLAO|nr:tail fiber protein [Dokdonia pacifica]GGG39385.1 microcystin dependent MdpB family protein [Dokdonia pacifica]SNS22970.1 Microcystin-dependent protein [Dokdonia pacifica]